MYLLLSRRRQLEEKMMSDLQAQRELLKKASVPNIVLHSDDPSPERTDSNVCLPGAIASVNNENLPPKPMVQNRSRCHGSITNTSITPNSAVSFGNASNRTPTFNINSSAASTSTTSSGGGKLSNRTPDSSIMGSQHSMNRSSLSRTPRGVCNLQAFWQLA